jgi:hypothetical protein
MAGHQEDDQPGRRELDPVPEDALKRAREAFSGRATGPIARLVSDSLLERHDPATAHELAFDGAGARIEVRVAVHGSRSSLQGSIHGMAAAKAMLHLEGSELALISTMDEKSFGFGPLPHGIARMSFESADGSLLWTDWFQI